MERVWGEWSSGEGREGEREWEWEWEWRGYEEKAVCRRSVHK
jgi:hypothetical protein